MSAKVRARPGALLVLLALGLKSGSVPDFAGDCAEDAPALTAQADALLDSVVMGAASPESVERARRLYRRARVLAPSVALSLRAADLACAAGDEEECGDLLSEAWEVEPRSLTASDRLLLARRAEARRRWREAIEHYAALRSREARWVDAKIRRLEVEAEAEAIAAPAAITVPPAARSALAEARRALAAGDRAKARERLSVARALAPRYVEASLALAALETTEGRASEAIRAYRDALSADPGRVEALVALANLLWEEPDRAAKGESLTLLDRAIAARPEAASLLKTSAQRWAEWGDAPTALKRLDAYRRRAGAAERRATEDLRESLARRVDDLLSGRTGPAAHVEAEPSEISPAIGEWRLAQAYLRRGDPASVASALEHLGEAERLDPSFAGAPELAGSIHERRGELAAARAAYERAILADPSRAAVYERLALLLARQPGKAVEAEEAWRRAEQAGSSEALFHLARAAEVSRRRGEALALYRRYLVEAPAGLRADEASRAAAALESRRRTSWYAAAGVALALLVAAGVLLRRRFGGVTFETWLRARPARARDVRPIVGRLRHEVIKHGGLLLSDAARKIDEGDRDAQRAIARLLLERLYGASSTGLVPQAFGALTDLEGLARKDGYRLNLAHHDPLFRPIARGSKTVAASAPALSWLAHGPDAVPRRVVRGVVRRLERAAALLRSTSGAEMSSVLDRASSTVASESDLRELLGRVCSEKGVTVLPPLEWRGPEIPVRIERGDWETIWRNLFANALDAGGNAAGVRLGVFTARTRDSVTGTPIARLVLADDVARPLPDEVVRGRAADRGWGVVAELVRRNEGSAEVGPPPAPPYCKGIVLELPAVDAGATA